MRTVRDIGEDDATTTADVPGVPMPFGNEPQRRLYPDGTRTRVRKRKKKHVGEEIVINEWKTRQVSDDRWEVKVGKKWVQGVWRTIKGHRVFFKGAGGMLPAKSKAFTGVKPGILARIKAALFGSGAGKARRRGRSEGMETIRDVAAGLMEAEGGKSASKNVVELIALEAAEAPKVQRKLVRLLGDKAEGMAPELATALMPAITKWLEAKGVRVQGVSAAEKALRTAAKE